MPETLFPLPGFVCGYGNRAEFESHRPESGQWVFWEDRVELVLQGRYDEVYPLHVELSPTYLCNFACSWCNCRSAREDWSVDDIFSHPKATPQTVMDKDKLERIIDQLAIHQVGIMWVGGEPTLNQLLFSAISRSRKLGILQCLFTNGSLLNERRINKLLDAELVFIRISLDTANDKSHGIFHGYHQGRNYSRRVKQNLEKLVAARKSHGSKTTIGVSLVVDDRNIEDVLITGYYLAELCDRYGDSAIDYVIIRPTYPFYYSQDHFSEDTSSRLFEIVRDGSELTTLLGFRGVKVVAPKDSFFKLEEVSAPIGSQCLASSWFSEITPNGDMLLCSDRYGNPDYFIGNVTRQNIVEIWESKLRHAKLDEVEHCKCLQNQCPRNGRGFQLNRIFHEIERYRQQGQIDEVRRWINDLRKTLPQPRHPFFL